jgi:hypothetical protein
MAESRRGIKAIGWVRAPGESPISVIKRVFHGDRTAVKTLERVRVKEMFKCFAYDLYQLVTLDRRRLAVAMKTIRKFVGKTRKRWVRTG